MTTIETLEALRRDCESTMLTLFGGASFCEVHKDGRVTGGMKYHEGRLTLFGDVIRQLKRGGILIDILTIAEAKWSQQLTQHTSITWIAYAQGGVDAIEEIRQAIT